MDEQQEQTATVAAALYTQEQKEEIIGYLLGGNDLSDLAEQFLERMTADEIKAILAHLKHIDEMVGGSEEE